MYLAGEYVGGLGNQMFIVAATIALARQWGMDPVFEDKDYSQSVTSRGTYWDSIFKNLVRLPVAAFRSIPWTRCKEDDLPAPVDTVSTKPTTETKVEGYFQDYRYFEDARDELWKIWDVPALRARAGSTRTPGVVEIGVHFRMGDYKRLQYAHPLLPDSYYEHAILRLYTSNERFLVFCENEDLDCVRQRMQYILQNIGIDPESTTVEFFSSGSDIEDMMRLSLCDKIVVANSTFSWWSAWFNGSDQVVIPEQWFYHRTPDGLRYPGWIVLAIPQPRR